MNLLKLALTTLFELLLLNSSKKIGEIILAIDARLDK